MYAPQSATVYCKFPVSKLIIDVALATDEALRAAPATVNVDVGAVVPIPTAHL